MTISRRVFVRAGTLGLVSFGLDPLFLSRAAYAAFRPAALPSNNRSLVCLFQRGLLHYQKGRTNWEYASRLPPETAWRPTFLDLTRLFDREWYGRPSSDAEAVRECSRSAREILGAVRGAEEAA